MQTQKQPSIGVLVKRCSENSSKYKGENPCRSVVAINLLCNFIEIALQHRSFPVNLLHIFRAPFSQEQL